MSLITFFFLNTVSSLVFTTKNPVYAAFWLILTFVTSALLLWVFDSSFFALVYIIIYVGAIAVLFLFVIMMLDIKQNILVNHIVNTKIESIKSFFFLIVTFCLGYWVSSTFFYETSNFFYADFIFNVDLITSISIFGQILYNYYIPFVLIAGIILLVAILGAIILTLHENNSTNQIKNVNRQLARSDNFLSFFK